MGATANCWPKPLKAWGSNSSFQPHSWVIGANSHMLRMKQRKPNAISQRRSTRRASMV